MVLQNVHGHVPSIIMSFPVQPIPLSQTKMPNPPTAFASWAKYLVLDIISLGVPCKSAMMASEDQRETGRDYGTSSLVNSV
jgi:hypothetical protein